MSDPTYQPKGSMCMNCEHVKDKKFKCDELPFNSMKVVEHYGDARIVICTSYSPNKKEKT